MSIAAAGGRDGAAGTAGSGALDFGCGELGAGVDDGLWQRRNNGWRRTMGNGWWMMGGRRRGVVGLKVVGPRSGQEKRQELFGERWWYSGGRQCFDGSLVSFHQPATLRLLTPGYWLSPTNSTIRASQLPLPLARQQRILPTYIHPAPPAPSTSPESLHVNKAGARTSQPTACILILIAHDGGSRRHKLANERHHITTLLFHVAVLIATAQGSISSDPFSTINRRLHLACIKSALSQFGQEED